MQHSINKFAIGHQHILAFLETPFLLWVPVPKCSYSCFLATWLNMRDLARPIEVNDEIVLFHVLYMINVLLTPFLVFFLLCVFELSFFLNSVCNECLRILTTLLPERIIQNTDGSALFLEQSCGLLSLKLHRVCAYYWPYRNNGNTALNTMFKAKKYLISRLR